jgi:two-component system, cell cycle response regulator
MLRQTRIGRSIYVIALSAETDEAALIKAFEAGADDMLGVPLNPRLLLAKISAAKRMTALRHENEKDREDIRHFAAELAVSNRRLQEVALVDALTGFPNRHFFNERLQQEWATSTRSQRPISCFMLDLDNFKHINDTYGHDVGDSVLRQALAAIRLAVRAQDIVARTGGDEFVVLCPDTSIEAAMVCAERVRHSIESAQIQSGMLSLKISASIGVACRDHAIIDSESLLKRADQGMYLAKHGGRNRVSSMQLRPRANG